MVASIETELKTIKREWFVDNKYDSHGKLNIFGLLKLAYSIHLETKKLKTVNPEEISKNERRIRRDLEQLQNKLVAYVNEHSEDIVMLKYFSIKALMNARQMALQGDELSSSEVQELADRALGLNFFGEQSYTACIQTKYPNV